MIVRKSSVVWLAVCSCMVIGGSTVTAEPNGVVTVSSNAKIVRNGQAENINPLVFDEIERTVRAGDAVTTGASGSAVIRFADYGTVVNLWPESKLLLENLPQRAKHVALGLRLDQGTAVLTRKASGPGLVALVGVAGQVQGYVLLEEGSVVVSVEGTKVVVEALQGSARFIDGRLLDAPLAPGVGRLLSAGQQATAGADEAPAPVAPGREEAVWRRIQESTYAFGIKRCETWMKRAEEGDFTPVRSEESRAEPELVQTDFVPPQRFDQPGQLTAVSTIQATSVQSLRTVVSPVQGLVESGIPGSVIAGQRFRRSVIIGNPGMSGSGPITVNPAAQLLIRIAGQ